MPWVPRAGHVGLGVSIFSYDGEVRLGIACDAGLVPDPEPIVDGFMQEFDTLANDLTTTGSASSSSADAEDASTTKASG